MRHNTNNRLKLQEATDLAVRDARIRRNIEAVRVDIIAHGAHAHGWDAAEAIERYRARLQGMTTEERNHFDRMVTEEVMARMMADDDPGLASVSSSAATAATRPRRRTPRRRRTTRIAAGDDAGPPPHPGSDRDLTPGWAA